MLSHASMRLAAPLRALGWILTAVALVLLLIAPNANGPLLVLVWSLVVATFRSFASMTPGRMPRFILGLAFLWVCFLGAFLGGWFFFPAGIAFLVADWRTEARSTQQPNRRDLTQ